MLKRLAMALIALTTAWSQPVTAADYYVAADGVIFPGTPNGSLTHPWKTVTDALNSGRINGGDNILLMDGEHGILKVQKSFTSAVTIKSQNARNAHVEYIYVLAPTNNLIVQDLKVWPTNPLVHPSVLVYSGSGTADNQFINLDIRAGKDAFNYINWSAADWLARAMDGAMMDGDRMEVRQSTFTGVHFGVVISGVDGVVASNLIDGFSADGLRGNGARGNFRDNIVKNCISVDGNHADGFQAFSSSAITGLVLERNTIIEWELVKSHPLRCGLQGIGMFDGFFDNLTIRNNVIAVRNGHGISVFGARHATITNNTVVNVDGIQPGYPWIGIFPNKNGTPSTDVIVANNIAMAYSGVTDKANRVSFINNRISRNPDFAYVDISTFNYEPKPTSRFIDAADPLYAPALDTDRHKRPSGAGPDVGAIEVGSTAAASPPIAAPPPPITAATDKADAIAAIAAATGSQGTSAKFVPAP